MPDMAIKVNQHHGVGFHLIYDSATPMVSRHVDIVGKCKVVFGSAERGLGLMVCVSTMTPCLKSIDGGKDGAVVVRPAVAGCNGGGV